MTVTERARAVVVRVCELADLVPERGAAALVGDLQVALFRIVDDTGDRVFAVSHRDPFTGANVLARGIVGEAQGRWYVASPLHKQRFDLSTGSCLDDPTVVIQTFPARIASSGAVEISV